MGRRIRKDNLVHWVFAAAYIIAAVLTVIPRDAASKECLLGFKALCSFTPTGTAICVAMFTLHVILAKSRRKSAGRPSAAAN